MSSKKLQIWKRARKKIHDTHKYPVIVYPKSGEEPYDTFCRVHYDFTFLGDQLGTNFNYVEISDYSELKLVFWREETPEIKHGDIITMPWGQTYILEAVQQEDKFSYKANATLINPNREGDFAYPE